MQRELEFAEVVRNTITRLGNLGDKMYVPLYETHSWCALKGEGQLRRQRPLIENLKWHHPQAVHQGSASPVVVCAFR